MHALLLLPARVLRLCLSDEWAYQIRAMFTNMLLSFSRCVDTMS
jgi:hypothetical protein